jgi:microcompartment protein CcmL/EutN
MAIGGKGFVLLTGDVASVDAAVGAGVAVASAEGMLVGSAVIAAPAPELFADYA